MSAENEQGYTRLWTSYLNRVAGVLWPPVRVFVGRVYQHIGRTGYVILLPAACGGGELRRGI